MQIKRCRLRLFCDAIFYSDLEGGVRNHRHTRIFSIFSEPDEVMPVVSRDTS